MSPQEQGLSHKGAGWPGPHGRTAPAGRGHCPFSSEQLTRWGSPRPEAPIPGGMDKSLPSLIPHSEPRMAPRNSGSLGSCLWS